MPDPQTKSPAQNYATRTNIVYPGTREQADAVEEQARRELEADQPHIAEAHASVESDQALEVEVAKTAHAAVGSPRVQHALEANTEARAEHGTVSPEVVEEQVEEHHEQVEALAEAQHPHVEHPDDQPEQPEQPVEPHPEPQEPQE